MIMRKKNALLLFIKPTECCGCTACYAECDAKAIVMKSNCEGFLYPEINTAICTGCNKCLFVCPMKPIISDREN